MGAPAITPNLHPLRILPDAAAPPESRNPSALSRLERIALAQERTAEALIRLADRFDKIADRLDRDAEEFQEMVRAGKNLSAIGGRASL